MCPALYLYVNLHTPSEYLAPAGWDSDTDDSGLDTPRRTRIHNFFRRRHSNDNVEPILNDYSDAEEQQIEPESPEHSILETASLYSGETYSCNDLRGRMEGYKRTSQADVEFGEGSYLDQDDLPDLTRTYTMQHISEHNDRALRRLTQSSRKVVLHQRREMDSLSLTSLNFYVGVDSEQLARQRFANYLQKKLSHTKSGSDSARGSASLKRSLSSAYITNVKEMRESKADTTSDTGKPSSAEGAGCLEDPDLNMIINSLSKAIHEQILLTHTKGDTAGSGIFDETEYPIMKAQLPEDYKERCIDQENIRRFLIAFSGAAKLSSGNMLIVSIFISRLIVRVGLRIHNHTWKRIVIGTSIVVSKAWNDIPVHNSDFKLVLPALAGDGLVKLEREVLGLMSYNVSVSREDYARHYYRIRSSDDNMGAVLTSVKNIVYTTGPSPAICASKHEHLPVMESGDGLAHLAPSHSSVDKSPDVISKNSCTRSSETLPKWTSLATD